MKGLLRLLIFCTLVTGFLSNSIYEKYGLFHTDEFESTAYSTNPPPQRTGAPGENNCTQCHSGSTFSAFGNINYAFSNPLNEYYPDSTYTIDIGTNNSVNGFEMTILDANTFQAGTFTSGLESNVLNSGFRQYIRHSNPNTTNWTFQWTAPSTNVGNLTVYYAFNKSNNSGTSSGDSIFLGQETIFISSSIGLTDYEKLQNGFNVFFNPNKKEIQLSFKPLQSSRVMVHVQDINGRLIFKEDFGILNAKHHQKQIQQIEFQAKGVYIVSLFIDNYVLNQKVAVY